MYVSNLFISFFFYKKDKRLKEQRMEMMWRGSKNYGKDSQIFTGVNYNGYGPPGGFCFDDFCSDPPIQDDPNLYDNNVKERVDLFVKETCEQANSYKTNHIMLTMGSDFQFQNALKWFKNLDKLIKHVNKVFFLSILLFFHNLSQVTYLTSTSNNKFLLFKFAIM